MRTPIDLSGQRFGRLVAVCDVGSLRKFRLWRLRCDCGSEIERTSADVRHGKIRSCGCLQRDLSSERTSLKLEGLVFGRLTVLSRFGDDGHGHVTWKCACECGGETIVSGTILRRGKTKSCGCLQKEAVSSIRKAAALPPEIKRERIKASSAKQRALRKANPLSVMQSRLSRLHRHALAQVGAIKRSPTFEQLGYSSEQFVAHIERQFIKGMGWHNMSEWQIDHIIPIREAKTELDVVALNQLSNLRPMWSAENNRKKAKRVSLL